MVCSRCNDTGVDETGDNDLPCSCPAGATAISNVASVRGPVTGAEVNRHFLNGSPQPLSGSVHDPIRSNNLPGRSQQAPPEPPHVEPSPPKKRPKDPWQL